MRRSVGLRVYHEHEGAVHQAVWLGLEQVGGLSIPLKTPKVQTPKGWEQTFRFSQEESHESKLALPSSLPS